MSRKRFNVAAIVGCVALLLAWSTSCLDVGVERADHDLTIGKAQDRGASVEVEQGLAAVRRFDASSGALRLWGQAPALSWTLTTDAAPKTWTIVASNIMRLAELTVLDPQGDPVSVTATTRRIPTEGSWQVDLAPNTRYTMRLSPPGGADLTPWSFAIFADVQSDIDRVQDIYALMSGDPELQFGLISGDLTERGEPEQLERFQREMETLPFPCFATLGNHELGVEETLFHDYFGRGSFSFVWRGTRFTLLDSASATIAPLVHTWLDEWLEQGKAQPHAVLMHLPPLDDSGNRNGAFASRDEAQGLLARLARANVDLTVYGHVHTYESFSNAGIEAYITGGGGALPMSFDGIGRHYLKVSVDPRRQRFTAGVVRVFPQ